MSAPAGAVSFDLSGLGIRFDGLPVWLADRMREEWGAFVDRTGETTFLPFECDVAPEADDPSPFVPRAMTASFQDGTALYRMKGGFAEVPIAGSARVHLDPSTRNRQFLALVNLVHAAVAWRLPSRGGALLHAAGIIVEGRGFVLVGPEGSGKTTWALLAKSAGASVLSDDVVVVDPGSDGGYDVLGTPFRSQQYGATIPGRWPLAAILIPARGGSAGLSAAPTIRVRARLFANLPFVAEAAARDDRSGRLVELLATATPARTLTFGLDPAFVPLLASFRP